MREKSTRDIGKELEDFVFNNYPNSAVKRTNNSGAVSSNGDLLDDKHRILIDCKNYKSSTSINITKKDLEKIKYQARQNDRDWILVIQNKDGDKIVCMDFNTFATIYDNG